MRTYGSISEQDRSEDYQLWLQFLHQVNSISKDVERNTLRNNVAAGVRVRKVLRKAKKLLDQFIKKTLESQREIKEARKDAAADNEKGYT